MSEGRRDRDDADDVIDGEFEEDREWDHPEDARDQEKVKGKTPKNLAVIVVFAIAGVMALGMMMTGGVSRDDETPEEEALPDSDLREQSFEEELQRRQREAMERRRAREAEMEDEREEQTQRPESPVDDGPRIQVEESTTAVSQSEREEIERERALRERAAQSDIIALQGSVGRNAMRGGDETDRGGEGTGSDARSSADRMMAELRDRSRRSMDLMEEGLRRQQEAGALPSEEGGRNERWLERQRDQGPGDVRVVRDPSFDRPVLQEGSVIPLVLQTAVNSDLPGMVTARATRDIRDSVTGSEVVIPRGTRFVGEYNSDIVQGQNRLLFAFHRAMLPDGRDIDLGAMQGADAEGRSGMTGDVNTHFWSRLWRAGLVGAITFGIEENSQQPQVTQVGPGGGSEVTGGSRAAEIFGDVARDTLERNRNRPPTITIEAGETMNVMVNSDIIL